MAPEYTPPECVHPSTLVVKPDPRLPTGSDSGSSPSWLHRLLEYLGGLPSPLLVTLAIGLILLLGYADYLTGKELAFSIFYLLPIGLGAVLAGPLAGILLSAVSALTWAAAEFGAGVTYSYPIAFWWNTIVRFASFVIVAQTLAALRQSAQRERELARTDPLTGVRNRRFFYEALELEAARARRYASPFTAAVLDVDHFKGVNDRFGHSAGDAVLRDIARSLQHGIRTTDVVARLGGDEFALLFPQTGSRAAESTLRKLAEQLAAAMNAGGWPVTFSIGAVTSADAPCEAEEILRHADELMYGIKRDRSDGVRVAELNELRLSSPA